MNLGLDTNVNCQKLVGKIKEAGYSFLCRYYNINNPKKSLTFQEAMALSNAGLYIVVVWENGLPTSKGYFSYKRGFDDARHAYDYARRVIGQPG
ncbi:MAG TPA: glycoside hydrolase domain-containing protein, partial [Bacillota bacterium]|nr:glycoside hydrolase domain-containing protein [Bacillota bacterium]